MMFVRILRDKTTRGGRIFRAGKILELADGDAAVLIRRKIAEAIGVSPMRRPSGKRQRSDDSPRD